MLHIKLWLAFVAMPGAARSEGWQLPDAPAYHAASVDGSLGAGIYHDLRGLERELNGSADFLIRSAITKLVVHAERYFERISAPCPELLAVDILLHAVQNPSLASEWRGMAFLALHQSSIHVIRSEAYQKRRAIILSAVDLLRDEESKLRDLALDYLLYYYLALRLAAPRDKAEDLRDADVHLNVTDALKKVAESFEGRNPVNIIMRAGQRSGAMTQRGGGEGMTCESKMAPP